MLVPPLLSYSIPPPCTYKHKQVNRYNSSVAISGSLYSCTAYFQHTKSLKLVNLLLIILYMHARHYYNKYNLRRGRIFNHIKNIK